jgi:hypothetical protein
MSDSHRAVFLSYASPSFAEPSTFAKATADETEGRQDAEAARSARTLNIQRSTLNVQMTNATRRRRGTTG